MPVNLPAAPAGLRHDILVIDTSACMASSVDVRSLGSGPGKWGFAAVVGGRASTMHLEPNLM